VEIELRDLADIKPYPGNPRNNDAAVDAVAASILQFGWRAPIVVDADDVIIAGHTRYKAAQKLGLERVPVHVARDLTPEQARAYRIADNKTAELAEWDYELLPLELNAIRDGGMDLSMLGFDEEEFARLLDPGMTDGLTDPDEVPEPPEEPVTCRGDLWLLGRHRLLCGDARESEDLARLLEGRQADMLLTDPPYNVGYEGKTPERLTISNDVMAPEEYQRFLIGAFTTAASHLKPGGAFYLWHADTGGLAVRSACAEAGLPVRQCLVWVKSVLVPGRQDYQWRHEPCLYGWAEGAAHTWLSDRSQTTVLEFDKPARSADHPTMKPVALFTYLMGNSCRPGGLVLDPFAGSGTTLIAAERTGRAAALVELDPHYCDVIVRRFEAFTGAKAERVPPGGEKSKAETRKEKSRARAKRAPAGHKADVSPTLADVGPAQPMKEKVKLSEIYRRKHGNAEFKRL
jgi:site-specific DNA-methyltransferase (adenine-specific)